MVTHEGGFKIIDFGVSAFLEADNHTKLTKSGEQIVSGPYTDPQLIENSKIRDIRSDLYSVGAIWYYLLVGRAPVGGDIRKGLEQVGNLSGLQIDIVIKCLCNNPDERYQNCAELLGILQPSTSKSACPTALVFQNRITEVTRDAIFEYLIERNYSEIDTYIDQQLPSFQTPERVFYYFGKKNIVFFLERLYDLDSIPSSNAKSLREEIELYANDNSSSYNWVFSDNRLNLVDGNDEVLLKFICLMFHPVIRSEKSDWVSVKEDVNKLLNEDGYEIYESEKISGRTVYSYRYSL